MSLLKSTSQYSELEKELAQEISDNVGWFKPSSLNAVTGEAMRDKTKREAIQTQKKTLKE